MGTSVGVLGNDKNKDLSPNFKTSDIDENPELETF